jgi:hypothetical protein
VAECLLAVAPGDRLPTMRWLADRFGGSLGATQAVVARLEEEGTIATSGRGRKGAVMEARSIGGLWAAARDEPLVITLPLPSTRRVHALATALKLGLTGAGIEAYLGFIRGSQQRLAALRALRCHAAVMSVLAAGVLVGPDEQVVLALPAGSYVLEHRVLFRTDAQGDPVPPLRVGVDDDSTDFRRLSQLEFPASATRVSGSYMRLVELLNRGDIDAMVWDVEETFASLGPGVADRPLADTTRAALGDANTAPAIVVRRGDVAARLVLEAALHPATILEVADEVLGDRRNAEY